MHPRQDFLHIVRCTLGIACVIMSFTTTQAHSPVVIASTVFSRSRPLINAVGGRVISVGKYPDALVVDEQTRRVFVLNLAINNVGDSIGQGTITILDAATGALLRTTTIGKNPSHIIVDAQTGRIFVTVRGYGHGATLLPYANHGAVAVLDATSGSLLQTVSVGYNPHAIAIDQRIHHAFVVNANSVSVLDAAQGTIIQSIALGNASGAPAISDRSGRLFITNYEPSQVIMVDTSRGKIVHRLRIGDHPGPIAIAERTRRVFVADQTSGIINSVSVLDARSGILLRTTRVGVYPKSIIVDTRTKRVFVQNLNSVSTLDARTGILLRDSPVNHYNGRTGGMALDPDTNRLYVTSDQGLLVLDATSGAIHQVIPIVGGAMGAIALDTRTGRVFIVNKGQGSLTILNMAQL